MTVTMNAGYDLKIKSSEAKLKDIDSGLPKERKIPTFLKRTLEAIFLVVATITVVAVVFCVFIFIQQVQNLDFEKIEAQLIQIADELSSLIKKSLKYVIEIFS